MEWSGYNRSRGAQAPCRQALEREIIEVRPIDFDALPLRETIVKE